MFSQGHILAGVFGVLSSVGWILQAAGGGLLYKKVWDYKNNNADITFAEVRPPRPHDPDVHAYPAGHEPVQEQLDQDCVVASSSNGLEGDVGSEWEVRYSMSLDVKGPKGSSGECESYAIDYPHRSAEGRALRLSTVKMNSIMNVRVSVR
jgi:hypothetical protein